MCSRLLKALVIASEKAANVARLVRKNEHLFDLLVQEKTGDSANARFVRDFKTLADVLIQEMVKQDLGALVSRKRKKVTGIILNSGDEEAKKTCGRCVRRNEWQHVTIIDYFSSIPNTKHTQSIHPHTFHPIHLVP